MLVMVFRILCIVIFFSGSLYPIKDSINVRQDFDTYFNKCQTSGCILIYDLKNNHWVTNDSSEILTETLPASTFKIINTLIALETGVINDENEIIIWPGSVDTSLYGNRTEIFRDMNVKEAFEKSAGWVYIELARRIGKENYVKYLKDCSYGNLFLSQPGFDFWNFGKFGVTPVDQIVLLKNLYENKLPFSKRNMGITKRIMLAETTDDYSIRAKTGWTRDSGYNTGWWIGYVERNDEVYFFATRLIQDRNSSQPNFAQCRKDITKAILRQLNIIPPL